VALPLNKACNVEDFTDPELVGVVREVFPHDVARFGAEFPRGREYRKHWEVAMAVRALRAAGTLRRDADVLGVGAGNEPTVFFLTNHVRRVFATDLYLSPGWEESASSRMMTDPGRYWPGAWDRQRLVVQHMDALDLHHLDGSFDAVFSSSSLEHFGDLAVVWRSLAEMSRVLRPGGLLSLSTEYRLSGPGPGLPGVLMFDACELAEMIHAGGWEPLDPLDLAISPATRGGLLPFEDAAQDVRRHVESNGGDLLFHKLDWSSYPHILLEHAGRVWTSAHLAVRKPAR
jgi:SAM-dependent methyltransferase